MNLEHNEIPVEFLRAIPEGMKLVNRHGKEFLVVELVASPGGTSLMSEAVRIHGEPSIRLHVKIGNDEGLIFVDAYWGSHAKLFGFIPDSKYRGYYVEASVPGTRESLMTDYECDVEGCKSTRAIDLRLPGGENRVLVCAKMGCPGHRIELADLAKPVVDTISGINYFGAGSLEEDWFDHPDA